MKGLLLLIVKLYWITVPKSKRRKCIFRVSCSQHVYQVSKREGFYKGLVALKYRYLNCRGGFHIFENPIEGSKIMILPNGQTLAEEEIAERLIKFKQSITELN